LKVFTFIADSAPEAVAQIRAQLGPEAVVLNVRKVEADGLGKLWKKPRIEVLAHVPESEPEPEFIPPPLPQPDDNEALRALTDLRREIAELRRQMPASAPQPEPAPTSKLTYDGWKTGVFLENSGVLPRQALRIVEQLQAAHGPKPPADFAQELQMTRALLLHSEPPAPRPSNTLVFIGPPGSGKTTVLSKILARAALIEGRPVRVWRLDGANANTAESLSVYAEIVGAGVERLYNGGPLAQPGELALVDLPGVNANDPAAIADLQKRLATFPAATIHLTLNAAYDASILRQHLRAFSPLPITSLVFTHLDEETRWGKLLNFSFGTNFTISHLSAGQNVPGELHESAQEKIVARVIPSK
jgi:flagellar biosynthesis protein FlhF